MSKIWVILLMEADFNAANKIVYGNRMLANASKYKLMPEDIFSEINRMADDGVVAKILFYDIVRQRRVSAGIASVDAANCYDRMSHLIASLVFQSIRVAEKYVTAMLEAIEETKSFLQKILWRLEGIFWEYDQSKNSRPLSSKWRNIFWLVCDIHHNNSVSQKKRIWC